MVMGFNSWEEDNPLQDEVRYWQERCSEAERECDDLRREMQDRIHDLENEINRAYEDGLRDGQREANSYIREE